MTTALEATSRACWPIDRWPVEDQRLWAKRINDDLPFEARVAIAQCTSSELITVVTGEDVSDRSARVPYKEQSAGLHHGASILLAQLRLIHEPIRDVLTEKSADPGGLEPNYVRLTLIRALAAAAPTIIGKAATGTARGRFQLFVAAVFRSLEIDTDGIEKAIEHTLYPKPSRPKTRK